MAKQSGLGMRCYISGVDLSGDIGSITELRGGPAALPVTGIDKAAFERTFGRRDGALGFDAWYNPTGAHPTLSALPTGDVTASVLVGSTLGAPVASLQAKQIGYDPKLGRDGSLTFAVACSATNTALEWGVLLTAGTRTDTAATNGTGVDLTTVSTAFGWQAYLHVLAVAGTSVTVTLQDSADNSSWANLTGGAFTAATPAGSPQAQRLEGGRTATVRRYVRAITTGTFSSAAFVVQFVRNDTAVTF